MHDSNHIGEWLREQRLSKKMSQQRLANVTKLRRHIIADLERNQVRPSPDALVKLLTYFNQKKT
jgi:transcriptional regulator with XRE-family HTH domain